MSLKVLVYRHKSQYWVLVKLISSQLVKKFPTFYGTRRFITAFISTRHLTLYWAKLTLTSLVPNLLSLFHRLGRTKVSVQVQGTCVCFMTLSFYSEELSAPHPTPKLDHPLSTVHYCSFNIFAATLHIGGRSSIRNLRTCYATVAGTH